MKIKESLSFSKVVADNTSEYYKIKKEDYQKTGLFKIIDQGQGFIGGYTNNENLITKEGLPVIVFGDHTKILKYCDFPFAIGADGVKILKVDETIANTLYVYYYLKTVRLAEAGYSRHFKFLKDIRIPIIEPIEDQIRIANVLSKAEALIQKRKESIGLLDKLLKSTFLEMFGDPVKNEKGWEIKFVSQIADILTGFAFKSDDYSTDSTDIKICGGLIIYPDRIAWENASYWSRKKIKGLEKYWLEKGDIVMALDRPWITEGFKLAMINKTAPPSLLIQRTARIRTAEVSRHYLYFLLKHKAFEKHCKPTETTVPHISPKEIQSFVIPIPPIELQNQFDQIVEKAETLKAQYQTSLTELENLYASLSQQAFKGELDLSKLEIDPYAHITTTRNIEPVKIPTFEKYYDSKQKEPEDKRYGDPFEGKELPEAKPGEILNRSDVKKLLGDEWEEITEEPSRENSGNDAIDEDDTDEFENYYYSRLIKEEQDRIEYKKLIEAGFGNKLSYENATAEEEEILVKQSLKKNFFAWKILWEYYCRHIHIYISPENTFRNDFTEYENKYIGSREDLRKIFSYGLWEAIKTYDKIPSSLALADWVINKCQLRAAVVYAENLLNLLPEEIELHVVSAIRAADGVIDLRKYTEKQMLAAFGMELRYLTRLTTSLLELAYYRGGTLKEAAQSEYISVQKFKSILISIEDVLIFLAGKAVELGYIKVEDSKLLQWVFEEKARLEAKNQIKNLSLTLSDFSLGKVSGELFKPEFTKEIILYTKLDKRNFSFSDLENEIKKLHFKYSYNTLREGVFAALDKTKGFLELAFKSRGSIPDESMWTPGMPQMPEVEMDKTIMFSYKRKQ